MRNGSEVRDPLVTYEGSDPPASPLQGDLKQELEDLWIFGCGFPPPLQLPSTASYLSCLNFSHCPLSPELIPCSQLILGLFPIMHSVITDNLVIALHSYKPSHDGDLGFEKGEQLRILEQ